eukprot:1223372-Rhodomonas_salina.1
MLTVRAAAALLLEHNADPNQLYPSVTAVTQYNTPLRLAAQRGDAGLPPSMSANNLAVHDADARACCVT